MIPLSVAPRRSALPSMPCGPAKIRQLGLRAVGASRRRGNLTTCLIITIPTLFVLTAIALDLAIVHLAHQQLQQGVDAGALAGAAALMEAGPPPNWGNAEAGQNMESPAIVSAEQVARVRHEAVYYANQKRVLGRPLALDVNHENTAGGDVAIGWLEDPTDLSCEMIASTARGPANTVVVRAERTGRRGNPISLWFGRLAGHVSMDAVAAARATVDQRVYGFRPVGHSPVPLVPLLVITTADPGRAHDSTTLEVEAENRTATKPAHPPPTNNVSDHSGRRPEQACLEAEARAEAGTFANLRIVASTDSTASVTKAKVVRLLLLGSQQASLRRRIEAGLTTNDLASLGGQIALNRDGRLPVRTATPDAEQLHELRSSLLAIRGQTRVWPLGLVSTEFNDPTCCEVTGYAAGSVVDCYLGPDASLVIVVEPRWLQTCTALVRAGVSRNPWIGKLMLTR